MCHVIVSWLHCMKGKPLDVLLFLNEANISLFPQFCILSSSTFAMTAVLGRMVSGVLILYSLRELCL